MDFKSNPSYLAMDGSIPDVSCPFAVQSIEKTSRLENGSHLTSDISEIYAKPYDDSPSIASTSDLEQTHRRKYGYNHIPKLDRTMTDIYGDELYNPNFAITSTSPPQSHSATSTGSEVFNQRINAANHQHLSAVHSPGSSKLITS
ncbi:hypothetical protein E4U42_003606 [Claviceps africana]|uniref:Uncharacterized protein n=1 Tax=Claviceps africana TaxID=83212 RepID=A0A8K0JJ04_9HYPO|nr:hypothetical protein E4U42_003606 [Claviceps africana]